MVLPNFICLGAGKTGTTSLHHLLRQHPDVFLVPYKEAHFFDDEENFAKGPQWYASIFAHHGGQRRVGDITPAYFFFAKTYRRIADVCGRRVKLILILRHPVTRAYSHYLHDVRLLDTNAPFCRDGAIVNPLHVDASTYSERLRQLLEVFDRRQLLVLIYERDIASGRLAQGYGKVAAHLGLAEARLDFNQHRVKAFVPRITRVTPDTDLTSFRLSEPAVSGDVIIETVRDSDAGERAELLRHPTPEQLEWLAIFEQRTTRTLPEDQIGTLFERHFRADVEATRSLLGDPIPEWES